MGLLLHQVTQNRWLVRNFILDEVDASYKHLRVLIVTNSKDADINFLQLNHKISSASHDLHGHSEERGWRGGNLYLAIEGQAGKQCLLRRGSR